MFNGGGETLRPKDNAVAAAAIGVCWEVDTKDVELAVGVALNIGEFAGKGGIR